VSEKASSEIFIALRERISEMISSGTIARGGWQNKEPCGMIDDPGPATTIGYLVIGRSLNLGLDHDLFFCTSLKQGSRFPKIRRIYINAIHA
jgi:hypothetical protein